MLIPFEFLSKLVPLLGNQPLVIELNGKKARFSAADEVFHLAGLEEVGNFPKLPDIPKKNSLELNEEFMTWLLRSMATASKDDLRPAMTKACLELTPDAITIVSTNAHALFKYRFPMGVPTTETILVSPKIGLALEGLEKTTLRWHSHHVAFQADHITVISTRSSDKYPDWKVVIPNSEANLTVGRLQLMTSLNKCLLTDDKQILLQFEPLESRNGRFKLASASEERGRDSVVTMPGEYAGKTLQIALAPVLLRTVLGQLPFDDLFLHIDGPNRGVVITSEEDANYLGLIMPLMLQ
jgi:DNA polymerase-3 subunit beta